MFSALEREEIARKRARCRIFETVKPGGGQLVPPPISQYRGDRDAQRFRCAFVTDICNQVCGGVEMLHAETLPQIFFRVKAIFAELPLAVRAFFA